VIEFVWKMAGVENVVADQVSRKVSRGSWDNATGICLEPCQAGQATLKILVGSPWMNIT
jgi:hypothetical protein